MFEVKLAAFEGPLDLLLHLIKKHELSIFDIPIAFITERFLEALAEMERLDLQVGGEFLVMAATLAHIKSRLLLPRAPREDEEEAEGADPREELVRQLVEYQRYKTLAESLDQRDVLGRDVFARPGERHTESVRTHNSGDALDLLDLLDAFEQVRRRVGFRKGYEILVKRRTVHQEMVRVARSVSKAGGGVVFWELVEHTDGGEPLIESVVGTFLALLELARLGLIHVRKISAKAGDLVLEGAVNDLLGELSALAEKS